MNYFNNNNKGNKTCKMNKIFVNKFLMKLNNNYNLKINYKYKIKYKNN
jgi:hypothetical protein